MRRTTPFAVAALLAFSGIAGAQELPDYRFMVENMRTINSRFSELAIMPLSDTTYLLVSDRGGKDKYNNWIGGTPYDLFLVNRRNWYDIRPAAELNTKFSDGPVTVAGPGEWYITQTNNRGQTDAETGAFIYRLNISRAVLADGRWQLEELPYFKSKEYSFAHPAVSPDGRMLFLSSDIPGGYGGKDLYVCYRTADAWTAPENLGPLVNSSRDETFPFYHASGRLYFTSNRRGGYGGYDIWQSDKIEGGWTTASVLSEPVNSASNEYAIWFDDSMERGYFSSNRLGGRGGDDVYAIFVDRISAAAAETGPDRTGPADQKAAKVTTAGNGVVAPATVAAIPREMSSLDSAMHAGDLKNVYFGSGSAVIDNEAKALLNALTGLLGTYDDPVLELHAHADATGSYEENIALSERRARSVMQYLISRGVDMARLSYKPYGESQLAVSEGAAQRLNRRVEFRLMQYDYQDAGGNPPSGDIYVKRLPMLEPGGYYVQLLALGANSIFPGYKLRQYGAAVCYFERGLYKYVLGPFKEEQEARGVLESVRADYRDAFLFRNY